MIWTGIILLLLMSDLWLLCWATSIGATSTSSRRILSALCAFVPGAGMAVELLRAGLEVDLVPAAQRSGIVDSGVVTALALMNALPGNLIILAVAVAAATIGLVFTLDRLIPSKWPAMRLGWIALPIGGAGIAIWMVFELVAIKAPQALEA